MVPNLYINSSVFYLVKLVYLYLIQTKTYILHIYIFYACIIIIGTSEPPQKIIRSNIYFIHLMLKCIILSLCYWTWTDDECEKKICHTKVYLRPLYQNLCRDPL